MAYVTTNIRLEAGIYRLLKLKSAKERKSLSQLVRDAVAETYGTATRKLRRNGGSRRDPWSGLIGICRSGVRDGAVEHDRYLYGPVRRRSR